MPDVLVLRPEPDGFETARAVAAQGWNAVLAPLLRIEPVLSPPSPSFDALVVTSPRAVPDAPAGPAFVVGERTARLWRERDRTVLAIARNGAELLPVLRASGAKRLLHVCGRDIAFDFAAHLTAADDPHVVRHVVYRAVPQALDASAREAAQRPGTVALLTSPRIAQLLAAEGVRPHALALSDAVAAAWPEAAPVAREPTMHALLTLLGRPQP